jgi:regulator of sigma D
MTRKTPRAVGPFCLLLGLAIAGSAAAKSREDPTQELRRICQELLDAVAPGDVPVWKKYLDDRLLRVDENGKVQTKDQLLAELTPLPPGLKGSAAIDHFQAQVHGDVAVAAYEIQESLDYHGQPLHSRFRTTDTWIRTRAGWRLIAEQVAAALKDPPAISLSQAQLCAFDGTYSLTADIEISIHCSANGLTMLRPGRPAAEYLPETADVFFLPGQPRSRRLFVRDETGKVIAMLDRREGEDIRWNRKP